MTSLGLYLLNTISGKISKVSASKCSMLLKLIN